MNYQFIDTMEEEKVKQFLSYIKDSLYRARKFKWLKGMAPVWKIGKEKAEARLNQLQNKAA